MKASRNVLTQTPRARLVAATIALQFAYDGSRFEAYARNPGAHTVEAALIEALEGEGLVDGSFRTGSRTDRGVSAAQNVCRATLNRPHLKGLVPALNSRLPDGVWVLAVASVANDWNPRHGATRTYRYIHPQGGEDLAVMQEAAACFVGEHDMRAFARLEAGRNPVRVVDRFEVAADGDAWKFTCVSGGFLWNQVRRMVDACLCTGRGEATVADVRKSLAEGQPHAAFGVVPVEGLLLESVDYGGTLAWAPEAGFLERGRLARHWMASRVGVAWMNSIVQQSQ